MKRFLMTLFLMTASLSAAATWSSNEEFRQAATNALCNTAVLESTNFINDVQQHIGALTNSEEKAEANIIYHFALDLLYDDSMDPAHDAMARSALSNVVTSAGLPLMSWQKAFATELLCAAASPVDPLIQSKYVNMTNLLTNVSATPLPEPTN